MKKLVIILMTIALIGCEKEIVKEFEFEQSAKKAWASGELWFDFTDSLESEPNYIIDAEYSESLECIIDTLQETFVSLAIEIPDNIYLFDSVTLHWDWKGYNLDSTFSFVNIYYKYAPYQWRGLGSSQYKTVSTDWQSEVLDISYLFDNCNPDYEEGDEIYISTYSGRDDTSIPCGMYVDIIRLECAGKLVYSSDFSNSTDGWTCAFGNGSGNFGYTDNELYIEVVDYATIASTSRPYILNYNITENNKSYKMYIEGDGFLRSMKTTYSNVEVLNHNLADSIFLMGDLSVSDFPGSTYTNLYFNQHEEDTFNISKIIIWEEY